MNGSAGWLSRCFVVVPLFVGCASKEEPLASPPATRDVAAKGVVEGARREVEVKPEIAGTISKMQVREGQSVKKGEVLFEMSSDSQRAQLEMARAELGSADVQAQHADSDFQRSSLLFFRNAISSEEYDDQKFRRLLMQSRLAEARARLHLMESNLAKTRVLAPSDGRILQVFVESGASVGPDGPVPVLRLADLSRRRIRVFIEELDASRVEVGQLVRVNADAFPDREFVGKVAVIALRMGRTAVMSDAPEEYRDVYFRELLVDLDRGEELPLNLRVQVKIVPES
ncbi:MAG: efflux RND transporter periplasmic adaptor subunit [Gemmataceae bacterium]